MEYFNNPTELRHHHNERPTRSYFIFGMLITEPSEQVRQNAPSVRSNHLHYPFLVD